MLRRAVNRRAVRFCLPLLGAAAILAGCGSSSSTGGGGGGGSSKPTYTIAYEARCPVVTSSSA